MKQLKLRLTGTKPLMMHDAKLANPLNIETKVMKPMTAKRGKTDEDYELIARYEWEAGLYLQDGVVGLPVRVIIKTIHNGAKKTKSGKKFEEGVFVDDDFYPFEKYDGKFIKVNQNGTFPNPELDKYYEGHHLTEMVKISNRLVPRCRPIFWGWELSISLTYDEQLIDERTLIGCVEDAGYRIGFCEKRPRMGCFSVKKIR